MRRYVFVKFHAANPSPLAGGGGGNRAVGGVALFSALLGVSLSKWCWRVSPVHEGILAEFWLPLLDDGVPGECEGDGVWKSIEPDGIAGLPSNRGPLLVGAIGCLSKGKVPALYTEPNRPAYLPAAMEWGGNPLLPWITDISFSCK